MSKVLISTALLLGCATPALAASPADILAANKAATAGNAWSGKAAAKLEYSYSGQGMTGKVVSVDDLANGRWADDMVVGPASQAQGYDGAHAWARDPSGTVTQQDGGDARPLSVNDGYRRANLWWQPGFGGAAVLSDGEKTEGTHTYDVLTVTPKGGKNFDAWFDTKTHLLSKIVEAQGPQMTTTTLSDYRAVNGVQFPYATKISVGDTKYDQNLTITSVTFLAAQPDSTYAMPASKVADFSIAGGAAQTTVPFQLINNHIYADVAVNGKPFTFIFDTGGVNLVTPTTAQKLGLTSEGHMQGNGAGEGHMDIGLTKVKSLEIGAATVKDQVFPVAPIDQLSDVEGFAQQGMVGFETFRRFVTRVDYGNKTITLIDPKKFDAKDAGTGIPFVFYGNGIAVDGTYAGHKGSFTVDTGSRVSLTLNGPFAAKNGISADGEKSVRGVTGWGIGGPSHAIVMRGAPLSIGPFTIAHPVAEISTDKGGAFADASLAGNIGAGVLKRYVVTLDYEHSTMYLKPIATEVADIDTFDRAGLWLNADPAGFKVIDVTATAPAEAAGLKPGDIITAVDGKAATSLKVYELRRELRNEAPGTVVTFAVKRGNETKDLKVTLRDLI